MAKGTQTFWVLSQIWNINHQLEKKNMLISWYWSVYTWENQGDFHQIADVYETAWNFHQIKAKIDIVVYCNIKSVYIARGVLLNQNVLKVFRNPEKETSTIVLCFAMVLIK